MGSPDGEEWHLSHEGPVHRVLFNRPFAIGKYEVTFAEWDACVANGGCNGYRPEGEYGRGRHPVIDVNHEDAKAYTAWLSQKTGQAYRLPSEAEWEYAARAGTTTLYHFGDSMSASQANYDVNVGRTVPVGSYPPNACGLHDVHGNIREWVEDCWNDSYVGAPTDGNSWAAGDCDRRILRGGSFHFHPGAVRSAERGVHHYAYQASSGFRIARSLP